MRKLIAAFILTAGFSFSAPAQEAILTVPATRFAQAMDSLDNYQLVDVRTRAEFKQGYIDGAKQHDINKNRFKRQISWLDRDQPVLLYCRTGKRSHQAALILQEMGFREIINLEGGITAWTAEGHQVVGNNDRSEDE